MWLDVLNFFFVEFDFKGAAAGNDDDALRVFGGLVEEKPAGNVEVSVEASS